MPIPLSRRRFLVGTAGAVAAAAAAAAALGDGFLIEPVSIDVTRHDIPIPGLAHELDGFRVACITDVHLHRGIHRAARATLKLLAPERPHLVRSEEHTSELQSRLHLVCRLLLEKKKK